MGLAAGGTNASCIPIGSEGLRACYRSINHGSIERGGLCARVQRAAHAEILKAEPGHFRWVVDVPAVEEHRAAHRAAHARHVELLELIPLGDERHRVASLGELVG